jgi:hypothetical protein
MIPKSPSGAKEEVAGALPRDSRYQRHVSHFAARRYITPMSTGTSPGKYRCAQCERPEAQCECDKFCCLCQTQLDVRICQDGLMYCEPCRNACDYKTSE